jgi:hypothetical protein
MFFIRRKKKKKRIKRINNNIGYLAIKIGDIIMIHPIHFRTNVLSIFNIYAGYLHNIIIPYTFCTTE